MDDFQLFGADLSYLKKLKQQFSNRFKMKDLGPSTYYLGMEFIRTKDTLTLKQIKFIKKVLKRFNIEDYKPVFTPMKPNVRFIKAADDYKPLNKHIQQYKSAIGSVMYLIT